MGSVTFTSGCLLLVVLLAGDRYAGFAVFSIKAILSRSLARRVWNAAWEVLGFASLAPDRAQTCWRRLVAVMADPGAAVGQLRRYGGASAGASCAGPAAVVAGLPARQGPVGLPPGTRQA